MKQRHSLFLLLALLTLVVAIWSYILIVAPQPRTLDQRVNDVAAQLKCPVCQNESVASSSASIAEQMRLVIRQQLQAGHSEQQVLDYFAVHYGNQILLTPPRQGINLLAWLVPIAALLLGLGLVSMVVHEWHSQSRLLVASSKGQTGEEAPIEPELEQYRAQLEEELGNDDLLFG